eukprot:SAG11_NODE_18589_length_486_cov_2.276486_2_plen_27_part_01
MLNLVMHLPARAGTRGTVEYFVSTREG